MELFQVIPNIIFMRIIIKKLAYLLLMLSIAGSSAQALYASSFDKCEHHDHNASPEHHMNMKNQHSQQAHQCCDDDCGCDSKSTTQINLPADSSLFQYDFSQAEISVDIISQHKQVFINPLLKPPIE